MHSSKDVLRVPRPAGLTLLCKNLKKPEIEDKHGVHKQILKLCIANYVQNGFIFLDREMSIIELSIFLKCKPQTIIKEMARYSQTLASITNPDAIQQTQQAMFGLIMQHIIKDRAKLERQANMLVAGQKGKYVDFMTKEVNAALKNLMDSNKPMIDLLKLLQGNNGGLQLNKPETPAEIPNNAISPTEAILIMAEHSPHSLLESTHKQEALQSQMGSNSLREVVATKQNGTRFAKREGMFMAKGKHIDRNEDDGQIMAGVEDTDFEELIN